MFILEEDVYGLFQTTSSQLPFIDPDSQSPSNITQTLAQKPKSTAIMQMFKEIDSIFEKRDLDISAFPRILKSLPQWCPWLSRGSVHTSPRHGPGLAPDSFQCQMLPRLSVAPGARRWLWPQNSGCHDYVDGGLPGSFSIPDLKRFPSIPELIIVLWISTATVYNECLTCKKSNSQES